MSNKQITKLAGALDITYYDAGDYILKQGESGDSFYIIEEGTVKCTQRKTSGRECELM
jgi:CRP-like cAMP-binding protein